MSETTAHVLVVGGGAEIPGVIRTLGGEGTRTSVICRTSLAPLIREPDRHTRIVALPADASAEEWVQLARAVHAAVPVTAVGSFGESDQDHAARIAAALGLVMHDPQTVAAVHDKALMRARLAAAGVDDTPAAMVRDLDEAHAFAEQHGYPLIVKPVRGSASSFVTRVDSANMLADAFERATTVSEWSSGSVLLERFMTGPQVSVEAFSENGEHLIVAVTAKFSEPVYLVEIGHVCPADLDDATRAGITDYVSSVLTALGVRFGPTHTELVLTTDGPRVIETHLRLAGDKITDLVLEATGVDLVECVAKQILGHEVLDAAAKQVALGPTCSSAIWFVAPDAAGVLREVEGIDAAAAAEGVTKVKAQLSPGDRTAPLRSSFDRGAYVRARADTAAEAVRLAREAAGSIGFIIRSRQSDQDTV